MQLNNLLLLWYNFYASADTSLSYEEWVTHPLEEGKYYKLSIIEMLRRVNNQSLDTMSEWQGKKNSIDLPCCYPPLFILMNESVKETPPTKETRAHNHG